MKEPYADLPGTVPGALHAGPRVDRREARPAAVDVDPRGHQHPLLHAGGAPTLFSGQSYGTPEGDVYRLGYLWRIAGPIDAVFHYLSHGRTFPDWWPVFLSAESEATEPVVGSSVRYHVKSDLPYHLYWDVTLVRLEEPSLIETATRVELSGLLTLQGRVTFQLEQRGPWVAVLNDQEMRTDRRLPAPLRTLAGRAFAFNHHRAMRLGGRGLQQIVRATAPEAATRTASAV